MPKIVHSKDFFKPFGDYDWEALIELELKIQAEDVRKLKEALIELVDSWDNEPIDRRVNGVTSNSSYYDYDINPVLMIK